MAAVREDDQFCAGDLILEGNRVPGGNQAVIIPGDQQDGEIEFIQPVGEVADLV